MSREQDSTANRETRPKAAGRAAADTAEPEPQPADSERGEAAEKKMARGSASELAEAMKRAVKATDLDMDSVQKLLTDCFEVSQMAK